MKPAYKVDDIYEISWKVLVFLTIDCFSDSKRKFRMVRVAKDFRFGYFFEREKLINGKKVIKYNSLMKVV